MSGKGTLGKVIVLLLLIVLLSAGGILWFDYLGLIQAKSLFAPVYRLLGMEVQSGGASAPEMPADLDADRLAKRLEALDLRAQELNKKESDITRKETEIGQMMQELEDKRISQEEREKTFNQTVKQYEDREVNIERNAQYLTGMVPQNAVNILLAMEDQDIIDTLRKVEEIAAKNGTTSIVAFWLSLMPADRAAVIQRKMANKPAAIS